MCFVVFAGVFGGGRCCGSIRTEMRRSILDCQEELVAIQQRLWLTGLSCQNLVSCLTGGKGDAPSKGCDEGICVVQQIHVLRCTISSWVRFCYLGAQNLMHCRGHFGPCCLRHRIGVRKINPPACFFFAVRDRHKNTTLFLSEVVWHSRQSSCTTFFSGIVQPLDARNHSDGATVVSVFDLVSPMSPFSHNTLLCVGTVLELLHTGLLRWENHFTSHVGFVFWAVKVKGWLHVGFLLQHKHSPKHVARTRQVFPSWGITHCGGNKTVSVFLVLVFYCLCAPQSMQTEMHRSILDYQSD